MSTNATICAPLPFTITDVGNEAPVGPATNLANDKLGRVWKTAGSSDRYVIVDLGAATVINTVALLATNAASDDTFRVRGANTVPALSGAIPGPLVFDQTRNLPASPEGLRRLHRQGLLLLAGSVSVRYVRIDITSAASDFSAGRLVIGNHMAAEDNVDYGWEMGVADLGRTESMPLGVDDDEIAAKVLAFSWKWSWLTEAEARGQMLDLLAYAGITRPVLMVMNPEAADLHNVIAYGKISEGAPMRNYATDLYDVSFKMRSMLVLNL